MCCQSPISWRQRSRAGSSAYTALVLDSRQRGLLYNTALLGIGTAVFATAIGAPLGVALARVPLRRKALLRLLAAAPVLLPPYVVALAWIYLGSSRGLLAAVAGRDSVAEWTYSLPAAVVVLSLVLYPLSMLATEVAMRRVDGRLEEAGLVVAPPSRVLCRITLPLVAPSVVAAALIIFVLAVSEFGVPGLLRVRVYSTEVFTAFAALYDFSRAMRPGGAPPCAYALRSQRRRPCCWAIGSSRRGGRLAYRRSCSTDGAGRLESPSRSSLRRRSSYQCSFSVARPSPRVRWLPPSLAPASAIVNSLLLSTMGATAVVASGSVAWLCAGARGPASRLAAQVLLRRPVRGSEHDRRCRPDRPLEPAGSTRRGLRHRCDVLAGVPGALRSRGRT